MTNEEVMAEMAAAADAAEQELRDQLNKMTPEQRAGAKAIAAWMKKHYLKAGYKRLSKSMIAVAN